MAPLNPLNGLAGKQPTSGLRSIKRDWSESQSQSQSTASQDSEIDWPSSPERPPRPKPSTGYESGRLARIQAVLASNTESSQIALTSSSSSSSVPRKRLSDSDSHSAGPASKKRVLPSGWDRTGDIKQEPKQAFKSASSTAASSFASASIAPQTYVPESEATANVARIFLSNEQQQILKLVEDGNNVFFTGSAGTGKSVLLREIIKCLRKKFRKADDAVAITASTGIAACNIGGVTLHSFGGIGLGLESPEQLATKIKRNKKASARWLRTQVLIIDEVSMVEGDLFDKLARIACIMRKNTKPFGGIQLIVTGDFFQLPPITKGGQVKFAFEAQKWTECIQRTFNLTKVFRQKDQEFVDMLNEMRFGRLSHTSISKFKSLSRRVVYEDGIVPTELFPRREDVDRANKARMQTLRGEMHTYWASDAGSAEKEFRDKQLSNLMAPAELQLRIDSQVMLIKNTDETLVNGSMGKVVKFVDPTTWNKADLPDEEGNGKPKPKSSAGVGGPKYPLVKFPIQGQPGQYREVVVQPETWKIELPNGEVQASRSQLPLILAWAMSIHKSQGQTLDRVKVDLGKVFEKGQAYVALSRATSLQGLEVLGFDSSKVQAHPKVAKWSTTLESFANT